MMKKLLISLFLFMTFGYSQSVTIANLRYFISELYFNRIHIDSILVADSTVIYIEGYLTAVNIDTANIGYINQDESITGNWINTTYPWAENELVSTVLVEADLNTFSELQTAIADKTLMNEEDIFTIDANWVNTMNPWAENELVSIVIVESEINTFAELQAFSVDKTLVNEEDDFTITGLYVFSDSTYIDSLEFSRIFGLDSLNIDSLNFVPDLEYTIGIGGKADTALVGYLAQDESITGNWINTAYPWADNEVANDITVTNYTLLSAVRDSIDIRIDSTYIDGKNFLPDAQFDTHEASATIHHTATVSSDISHDLITGVSTSDHHVQTTNTNLDSTGVDALNFVPDAELANYTLLSVLDDTFAVHIVGYTEDSDTSSWLATKTWVDANDTDTQLDSTGVDALNFVPDAELATFKPTIRDTIILVVDSTFVDGLNFVPDNEKFTNSDESDPLALLTAGTDNVKDTHIDWGTSANQVSAVDVPIADAGAKIIATEVEGALQENRTAIDLNTPKVTMAYPSAGIALSTGSAWSASITNNSVNWNTAYTDRLKWDGGATGLNAATGRTSLGGTTIGQAIFIKTNPGAITFGRANVDNTFDWLSDANFRTAINVDVAGTDNSTDVTIGTANGLSLSTQVLSMALSNGSVTGTLNSTNWNTFNNKVDIGDAITIFDGTAWRGLYLNATGDVTEFVLGANGTFLESNGASAAPAYRALLAGDIPDLSGTYQPLEATLTDIADGTINENLVNTAYPWAANEIVSTVIHESELSGLETDPNVDTEAEIEAITGAFFGTSKAVTSGYIWVADGVDFESVIMSGEATIASDGAITLNNDALDDQYYDSEGDLTTLLDDNYEAELNNSAGLLAALNDETGNLLSVFSGSPTFTTDIEVNRDNILVTQSDAYGLLLSNTTAATAVDSIQYSPPIIWQGYGWKTDATAESQKVEFRLDMRPVEGTSAPTGNWVLERSINDGAYFGLMTVTSDGDMGIGTDTPDAKLTVIGNTNFSNISSFGDSTFEINTVNFQADVGGGFRLTGISGASTTVPNIIPYRAEAGTGISRSAENTLGIITNSTLAASFDASNNFNVVGNITVGASNNYVMEGYAIGRTVTRTVYLQIRDGVTPGTNIDCTVIADIYNAPTMANATDLAKGGTSGAWSLSADGIELTIDLTETVIAVPHVTIIRERLGGGDAAGYYIEGVEVSGNILLKLRVHGNTTTLDWTTKTAASGNEILFNMTFYTST